MERSAYEGGWHTRAKTVSTYLAGKMIHIPFMPVIEEDILDGTLAAHHRAVILPGIDHLEPNVIAARKFGMHALHFKDAATMRKDLIGLGLPLKAK